MNNTRRSRPRVTSRSLVAGALLAFAPLAACNNAGQGALSGGAIGALGGLAIGSMTGSAGTGAAIGAVSGAVAGGIIGDQNRRAAEAQQQIRPASSYN